MNVMNGHSALIDRPLTTLLRHGFIPGESPVVDAYGRTFTYLRVSVTDLCNLRCVYCMPEEGMKWLPRSEVLTFEESSKPTIDGTFDSFSCKTLISSVSDDIIQFIAPLSRI